MTTTHDSIGFAKQQKGLKFSVHENQELDNDEVMNLIIENPAGSGRTLVIDTLTVTGQDRDIPLLSWRWNLTHEVVHQAAWRMIGKQ